VASVSGVSAVTSGFGTFSRWWAAELAGLAPSALRRGFAGRQTRVVLDLDLGGVEPLLTPILEVVSGSKVVRRRALASGAAAADLAVLLKRQRKRSPKAPVVLRLPHGECLIRSVRVPEQAQARLADILALDIERVTPFRRDQVYAAHTAAKRADSDGKLAAEQIIVERSRVDPVLAELKGLGVPVDRMDCWNREGTAPLPINLLGLPGAAATGKRSGDALTGALAAAVLLLSGSVVWMDFDRYDRALGEIGARLEVARKDLATLRKSRGAQETIRSETARLIERKRTQSPAVVSLDVLTRRIPDDSWLTTLHLEGQTADLFGFSKSATALVTALQTSATNGPGQSGQPVVTQARLTAPITFDTSRKAEQFSLRVTIGPPDRDRAASLAPNPVVE